MPKIAGFLLVAIALLMFARTLHEGLLFFVEQGGTSKDLWVVLVGAAFAGAMLVFTAFILWWPR